MEVQTVARHDAELRVTENELLILNNALNEVCNALDVDEFDTRMGATKEQTRALLNAIGSLIDRMLAT